MKPTKKQFKKYVAIRDSGKTNMFDVSTVFKLSRNQLTREHCLYIMKHFEELAEEYEVEI